MNTFSLSRSSGIALLAGSFLMIVTMVLHPVGGSIEHLLNILTIAVVSHAIAIASIPVSLFGYWGLSQVLKKRPALAMGALITMGIALLAAMLAATANGLVLPFFLERYAEADPETMETVRTILRYNFAWNHAFDFIFIVGSCVAIGLYAWAMLGHQAFPAWLSYVGMLIGGAALLMLFSGFIFVDLHGFRLFIFAQVSWIIGTGIFLLRDRERAPLATD